MKKKTKTLKSIYFFGNETAEGSTLNKLILGGKGFNLAIMTSLGIRVPPGFTISTNECHEFTKNKHKLSSSLLKEIEKNMQKLEKTIGKKFGDINDPLLVSVRSGAAISMPGMMDTILNLGLNDKSVIGLAKQSGSKRFAWDSYRRFIQMFCNVVLEVDSDKFEKIIEEKKKKKGVALDIDLDEDDFEDLVNKYKKLLAALKINFPQDPKEQLKMSIGAVFGSWDNKRAKTYRKINDIPDDLGTAVNIQSMVFGNYGKTSGTGVAFSRNPRKGEKGWLGEFLLNAQGEDVVAGIRTPLPKTELKKHFPVCYKELDQILNTLETHFKEMQDIEFTIEKEKLYLLQTRNGKRSPLAAVKIAVDLAKEGIISKEEAVMRISPEQIIKLLHPTVSGDHKANILAKGLAASPGAATGKIVFSPEEAEKQSKKEKVILVRKETSPEDIAGMAAAQGILTATGGLTSHAAIVAVGMGKPCIVGCGNLEINYEKKTAYIKSLNKILKPGDSITLNGSTGEVLEGIIELSKSEPPPEFYTLLSWADSIGKLKVLANAETPQDAQMARNFGAKGIGLARTEHMFFGKKRINLFRKMILADRDDPERKKALNKLQPFQKQDFKELFKIMTGLTVTVRLLDPPLDEFLPHDEKIQKQVAKELGIPLNTIKTRSQQLEEFNPMMGHRGIRLLVTDPEIARMQTSAIIEAAIEVEEEFGQTVKPEIMLPMVCEVNEFQYVKKIIKETADEIIKKHKSFLSYRIGSMVETPRAALTAGRLATKSDFFSFGTNDLTQMTFAFCRNDVNKFLPVYLENALLPCDPYRTLDNAVLRLINICVSDARQNKSNIKIGLCGEQGGDPDSIKLLSQAGLNYVSCSPFRVPVARLAAAQIVIEEEAR